MTELNQWQDKLEPLMPNAAKAIQDTPKPEPPRELPASTFSITAISPGIWDFSSEYPVLAVRVRYSRPGSFKLSKFDPWGITRTPRKPFYAKDTFFLTTDKGYRFFWISPSESNLYGSALSDIYDGRKKKRFTRYSLNKEIGDEANMIIPVRQFSITGIKIEGFDPEKEYPVLAVDIDEYIPEPKEKEEEEEEDLQPESMAFFLVGNNNGEFNWVPESGCRLYPLENKKPAAG